MARPILTRSFFSSFTSESPGANHSQTFSQVGDEPQEVESHEVEPHEVEPVQTGWQLAQCLRDVALSDWESQRPVPPQSSYAPPFQSRRSRNPSELDQARPHSIQTYTNIQSWASVGDSDRTSPLGFPFPITVPRSPSTVVPSSPLARRPMSFLDEEEQDGASQQELIDQRLVSRDFVFTACPAWFPTRSSCSPLRRRIVKRSYSGLHTPQSSLLSTTASGLLFPANSFVVRSDNIASVTGVINEDEVSRQTSLHIGQAPDCRPKTKRFYSTGAIGGTQGFQSRGLPRTLSSNCGQGLGLARCHTPSFVS